mgnify:CR=1 FL=1
MKESMMSEQLVLRWVSVVDASGESRLEAVWSTAPAAAPAGQAA